MARTTKLELQQALATMGAEVQQLRVLVSQLSADNARLAKAAATAPTAPGLTPARAAYLERRAQRVANDQPSAFQLACAAAREAAIQHGRVVRVEA